MNIQLAEFLSQPLMMEEHYLRKLCSMSGLAELSATKPQANDVRMAAERQATAARGQAAKITAVIPIMGIIDQRSSWMLEMFGGTSLESLMEGVSICVNEPKIGGIILDVHSPGGSAYGVKEAADAIFAARGQMPIVAVSNSVMASAAAYLGLAASRVYATPTSVTGSIGVAWEHQDESKALADAGVTTTILRIPEYKAEGNPSEPLTDAAKLHMETRISDLYEMFTGDLAKYRGTDKSTVKANYGMGRVMSARDAVAAGMADGVMTFPEVVDAMSRGSIHRSLAQTGRMEGEIDAAVLRNRMAINFLN